MPGAKLSKPTPGDSAVHRYYAQQRAADAISSNTVKDELKRHSRINRQLAEEQRIMEELYQVSTPCSCKLCLHLQQCWPCSLC